MAKVTQTLSPKILTSQGDSRLQLQKDTCPVRDGGHHWSGVGIAEITGEFYYYSIFLRRKNNESCFKAIIQELYFRKGGQ